MKMVILSTAVAALVTHTVMMIPFCLAMRMMSVFPAMLFMMTQELGVPTLIAKRTCQGTTQIQLKHHLGLSHNFPTVRLSTNTVNPQRTKREHLRIWIEQQLNSSPNSQEVRSLSPTRV